MSGTASTNLLAVELQHDAQHAVRARMVRPEVEEHEIGVRALPLHAPVFRPELQGRLLAVFLVGRQAERLHFGGPGRMLLAQRMALPGRRHENPRQVRMAVERDAEHVPHFALVPVGRRPEVGDRSQCADILRSSATFTRISLLRSNESR